MNINQVLAKLDPLDDEHWTADGLPRVEKVSELLGSDVKRQDITNAAPKFTRNVSLELAAKKEGEAHGADASSEPGDGGDNPSGDANEPASGPEAGEPIDTAGASGEAGPLNPEPEGQEEGRGPPVEPEASPEHPNTHVLPPAPEAARVAHLEAQRAGLEEARDEALRRSEAAKAEFTRINDEVNTLNRRIEVLHKADPNHGIRGIKDYLATQQRLRMEKATRLAGIVSAAGVSPAELASQLSTKTPLDKALTARRPPRGAARPNYPNRAAR